MLGDGGWGGEGGLEHRQGRSWAGSGGGEVEGADGDVEGGLDRAAAVRLRAALGGGREAEGGLGRQR